MKVTFRVEIGWDAASLRECGHRHRRFSNARDCGWKAKQRLGSNAVRIKAVDGANVVRHVEFHDGSRVAGEPWDPAWLHEQTAVSP